MYIPFGMYSRSGSLAKDINLLLYLAKARSVAVLLTLWNQIWPRMWYKEQLLPTAVSAAHARAYRVRGMSKGLACAWERLTRASMSARKCYDRYELSGTEAVSLARARKQSVGRTLIGRYTPF